MSLSRFYSLSLNSDQFERNKATEFPHFSLMDNI